ncbi:MAG: protein kinase domain-containing protein [Planctomycetota bacterium]|jgi:serine/threonine protein kinase/tetratricopeptide (TPR) repeat protein
MNELLLEYIYRYVDGDCIEAEVERVREAVRQDPRVAEELFRAALDRTLLAEVFGRSGRASPTPGRKREAEMARLVVREGEAAGRGYVIRPGKTHVVFGRRPGVEFQVLDEKASREHAEVVFSGGRFIVRDLQSRNGTYLDGRKLERDETLEAGSLIRIGDTVIEFLDESGGIPPGLRVPGQDLIERVGHGRMGTIYKARQLSMDRVVAVKVLNETYNSDRGFIERFVHEAQLVGRLSHANIIHMLDIGESERVHYYSMEFVDGKALKRLLRHKGRIGTDRALDIAVQAAKALSYAHESNVIHRDVKPANLMLTNDGTVKVADLGIAKTFEDSASASGVRGTPHYMSPEQAAGRKVDARTDVYSLGATLYHMLTGSLPFEGDDDYEVVSAHTSATLPAVQEREPDVPDSVARVVERMMARDPARRYQTMRAVVADLERVIADREAEVERVGPGESTVSRPVEAVVKKRRHARRQGSGLPGIGALVAVAALLLIGIVLVHHLATPNRSSSRTRPPRRTSDDASSPRVTRAADGRPLDGLGVDDAATATVAAGREEEGPSEDEGAARDDSTVARAVTTDDGAPPAAEERDGVTDVRGARRDEAPEEATPDAAPPEGPVVEEMIAATEGGMDLPGAGPTKPYPEVTEAAGFCRPGKWEKGALVLRDGAELKGEFRAEEGALSFREKPAAEPRPVSLVDIEDIAFRQPGNIHAKMGEFKLKQGRFDEALERFEKALAAVRDDPFVRKKIADIKAAQEAQRRIDDAVVAGDHRAVLDEMARYVRVLKPSQISPDRRSALEEAWRHHVGRARRDDRACWRRSAERVGVRLTWDERAPRYLAAAEQAAEDGERAAVVAKLFERALAAQAPFEDRHYLKMAKAWHELGKDERARDIISRVAAAYRDRPEVRALMLDLKLAAPPLGPRLLVCTFVGGKGDQHIREVGFSRGVVYGKGEGFRVVYDARSFRGRVQGDVNTHDDERYNPRPPLPGGRGKEVRDPRNGQTYRVGYRQVHAELQQPFLESSAGWKLWGLGFDDVKTGTKGVRWGPLMADSRAYDCWLMPEGKIAVKCWTDGGNSILTRDPRDPQKPNPIEGKDPFKRDAGGMASMFMLVDPKDGTPLSGTFLRSHITHQAVDAFGRVYLPFAQAGSRNPFDMAEETRAGLFVLKPSLLAPELNIRIGGGGKEHLGVIALKDGLLVLGGYTEAAGLKTVNPVQDAHGGGKDGFFVVLRLWD